MSLLQQALLLGAWIGLIHAFDADHLSTLGSLSMRGRPDEAIGYALRWACGHAVAIGALGLLALGLGVLWTSSLSLVAEILVAALLIALGWSTIRSVQRSSASGSFRSAAGDRSDDHHKGAGLLMGLLHGGAGSAAVLAILPLTAMNSGLAAFLFLTSFSLGVAAGALAFAVLFACLMTRARAGARATLLFGVLIGSTAILVGAFMLVGKINGT
jgi:hypothetical protein